VSGKILGEHGDPRGAIARRTQPPLEIVYAHAARMIPLRHAGPRCSGAGPLPARRRVR
jgi:hypothetical protein